MGTDVLCQVAIFFISERDHKLMASSKSYLPKSFYRPTQWDFCLEPTFQNWKISYQGHILYLLKYIKTWQH